MEVSVMGSSQTMMVKTEMACRELGFSAIKSNGSLSSNRISFGKRTWGNNSGLRLTVKAVYSHALQSQKARRPEPTGGVRFYVGLPTDTVSECNTVNHARAIAAGLKALKLLGVEGVELPVWWGVVKKDTMGKHDWSGYLAVAEMVEKVGLKLHITLSFHASKRDNIPLPNWISEIGKSQPHIFFTDRSGKQYNECLSFSIDDSPIFGGKTPMKF